MGNTTLKAVGNDVVVWAQVLLPAVLSVSLISSSSSLLDSGNWLKKVIKTCEHSEYLMPH